MQCRKLDAKSTAAAAASRGGLVIISEPKRGEAVPPTRLYRQLQQQQLGLRVHTAEREGQREEREDALCSAHSWMHPQVQLHAQTQ